MCALSIIPVNTTTATLFNFAFIQTHITHLYNAFQNTTVHVQPL